MLSCLAAILISVPIAFFMVLINLGLKRGFFIAFIKSALVGTAISIPLANIAIPLAEKIVSQIVCDEDAEN